MKVLLRKLDAVTTAEVMDGYEYIFSMSNLCGDYHGEQFRFWLDDAGESRIVSHNSVRFKADNGDTESQVILIIPQNGASIYIDMQHTNPSALKRFKYETEVLEFMEEFRDLLLMQWYGEISSDTFKNVVKLVRRKGKSLDDAVDDILYKSIYQDMYDSMHNISEKSDYWYDCVTKACYYCDIAYVAVDSHIVDYAKNLINNVSESYWKNDGMIRHRNALVSDIAKIDNYK